MLLLIAAQLAKASTPRGADIEDNDFAEFEDFEEEGKQPNSAFNYATLKVRQHLPGALSRYSRFLAI